MCTISHESFHKVYMNIPHMQIITTFLYMHFTKRISNSLMYLVILLDFAAVGQYQLNYSISVGLLSKESEATIAPYLHARAEGTMTVGSTQFARVEFTGSLVETLLPLLVKQTFYEWPLKARYTAIPYQ